MMRLELPWPDYAKLSPNAKRRLHWRKYQPVANKHRLDCYLAARAGGAWPLDDDTVNLTVTFCPPDRLRRDLDGCIGAMKHGMDGLSDALGVDDRHFVTTYRVGDVVKGGAVLVEIGFCQENKGDNA